MDCTELALRDVYRRCLKKNIIEWGQTFFPFLFPDASPPFHYDLVNAANEVIGGAKKGGIFAAPRGHGKSTIISFILPLYLIVHKRTRFLVLCSNTAMIARQFLLEIKRSVEGNEMLRLVYGIMPGDTIGETWTQNECVIAFNDGSKTRVIARGTGAQIRGLKLGAARPDLIIIDDMEDKKLVSTAVQRQKAWDWLMQDVIPTLDPKSGFWLFLGTILHRESLLSKLLQMAQNSNDYAWRKYQSIENGKPLWESRFSFEKLNEIRELIGGRAFQTEYQNNPEDSESALWSRDIIDSTRVQNSPLDLSYIVVGVDPSVGGNAECGIIVAGIKDEHVYILADYSIKGPPDKWAKRAIDAYQTFNANKIIYETNQGGALIPAIFAKYDDQILTQGVRASRGKFTRAEPISISYQQGKVHHCGRFDLLEDQMCTWQPGLESPDRIDAMVWSVTSLQQSNAVWSF